MANWLFSQTNSTGSFQMLARFSPSWKAPLFTAPSPKNATATRSVLQQLEAVARAGRLQDARPDDAAGAHHADFGREQVHAAAAAARAAGRAAEQLGDQLARRHALGQRVAVAAVRAEDGVVGSQMRAHAGGDRFLADVGVAGAVDQPALMTAGELLLGRADQLHGAIEHIGSGSHCYGDPAR